MAVFPVAGRAILWHVAQLFAQVRATVQGWGCLWRSRINLRKNGGKSWRMIVITLFPAREYDGAWMFRNSLDTHSER